MTTVLDQKKIVAEETYQGIEAVSITVIRKSDMTVDTAQSSLRVAVVGYNDEGESVSRETINLTVDELNAGGTSLQELLNNTKLYYQHIVDKAREFGIIGTGTDSEDL